MLFDTGLEQMLQIAREENASRPAKSYCKKNKWMRRIISPALRRFSEIVPEGSVWGVRLCGN
jgi:hypothetical protein